MGMDQLDSLVGKWKVEVDFPGAEDVAATTIFEWILGGAFLQQRSEVDHPAAPDALCVIGPDGRGGFTQHYFDSRGVARVYEMTFENGTWELLRVKPDFTALSFSQRYRGRFSSDGRRIDGQWETSDDRGETWQLDFHMNYLRV